MVNRLVAFTFILIIGLNARVAESQEPTAQPLASPEPSTAVESAATTGAAAQTNSAPTAATEPAATYKEYQVDPLVPVVNRSLAGGRNFERGRELFNMLSCSTCHQFGGTEGVGAGIGPDLTGVGGRFGVRDILDSIINPSNNISNLFGSWDIYTSDGKSYRGKIIYETDDEIALAENVFALTQLTMIKQADVEWIEESTVSLMPTGLINALSEEDIENLLAFLISGGNSDSSMFKSLDKSPQN